jgi:hypothetical protein
MGVIGGADKAPAPTCHITSSASPAWQAGKPLPGLASSHWAASPLKRLKADTESPKVTGLAESWITTRHRAPFSSEAVGGKTALSRRYRILISVNTC